MSRRRRGVSKRQDARLFQSVAPLLSERGYNPHDPKVWRAFSKNLPWALRELGAGTLPPGEASLAAADAIRAGDERFFRGLEGMRRLNPDTLEPELRKFYDQVAPIIRAKGGDPNDPEVWVQFKDDLPMGIEYAMILEGREGHGVVPSGYDVNDTGVDVGPSPPIPIHEGEREGEHVTERLAVNTITDAADAALAVPIPLLVMLVNQGAEHGLRYQLDSQIIGRLETSVKHQLHRITRIHVDEGEDFFRCQAALLMADGKEEFHVLDLTSRFVGSMVEAVEGHAREHGRHPALRGVPLGYGGPVTPKLTPKIPRWAGSVSYGPALEHARKVAGWSGFYLNSLENSVRQVLSITEATFLTEAHVVRVDPEQVEVLPEWDSHEDMVEFAIDAQLPFDTVYLDFEGPGGIAPRAGIDGFGRMTTISGALMFRKPGSQALAVAPVGWPEGVRMERDSQVIPWSPYETAGWFVFERDLMRTNDGEVRPIGDLPVVLDTVESSGAVATCVSTGYAAFSYADDDDEEANDEFVNPLPGYAIIPHSKQAILSHYGMDDTVKALVWWSNMLWILASKALAALSIVEAEEVVLVDAPMEVRDRKRAEKRGWPIAQQVVIRPSTRRRDGERTPPSGEEAHYSHRFWVRGHFKHFPIGTRMADVRPDLVRPCPRSDAATNCGFCRRVWTPPFIKGPEDAPLVLKTLVRHPKKQAV